MGGGSGGRRGEAGGVIWSGFFLGLAFLRMVLGENVFGFDRNLEFF